MKPVDKKLLLEELERTAETHVKAAVETLQNLSGEQLLKPSAHGGWSAAQCLEHLNLYGQYYLPRLGKALESAKEKPDKDTFKSSRIGAYFKNLMDPQTGSRKFKAFKDYRPGQALVAHEVVAEFIRQQELLLLYLHQAQSVDLHAARIPVSIAPFLRLQLGDVFQFMVAHNERHVRQALKVLQEV